MMKHLRLSTAGMALTALCAIAGAPAAAASDDWQVLIAQASSSDDDEALKTIAIEGLMAAPPERAVPLLRNVIEGDHSASLKRRALFVLGQTDAPEAQTLLLAVARDGDGALRHEAIRAIGIGGDAQALSALIPVYRDGDEETRDSVLSAMLIANAPDGVLALARSAETDDEFAAAVRTLGAMGATDELRTLLDDGAKTAGLVQAYAIAGDLDGLQRIAAQTDDPEQRLRAISAMGMVGDGAASDALAAAYRGADSDRVRDAALQGLLISGDDAAVLGLFRASSDGDEKRRLLRTLMHMDSDLVLDVIDDTLEGEGE